MFHTFLNPINDFSGGASAASGIALPPIAVIATAVVGVDQLSPPRAPSPPVPARASTDSTANVLGDWLDNLPARDWDA